MSASLRTRTLHALSWNFAGTMAQRMVMFVVSIVLARLLLPEQFGLIGMLTIFIAIAQTFINSGFTPALIQKKDHDRVDECSVFYFNIFVGLLAYAILFVAAPWIANFYSEPLLTPLARVIGLILLISPFGMIQRTLMSKQLNFKALTAATFIASLSSGILGVILAYHGFGVWALVYQQLTSQLLLSLLFWFLNPWRPSLIFSISAIRKLFAFGSKLLASGLLDTFFRNIYLVIIGRLFSPAALGFYTKAHHLERMPTQTLTQVVRNVMFPVFSHIQDEPERLRRALSRAMAFLVMLIFPMMLGLAVVARPFVHILLTEKWSPCVPYLQLLCIAGMLYPLHVLNLNVLQATGRSDLFLKLEIIKKTLTVINISIAWNWGITGLIVGQVIGSFISYFLNARYTRITAGYPLRRQLHDIAPYAAASVAMAGVVYSLQWTFLAGNDWSLLVSQIITGGIVYLALCWIFRLPAFTEAREIVHGALHGQVKSYIARQTA